MRKFLAGLALAAFACASFGAPPITLLDNVTATGVGTGQAGNQGPGPKTYQVWGATTNGAGAASVDIECSMDGTHFFRIGTVPLTLSTSATTDGFTSFDRCVQIRGNTTSLSGTGAGVSAVMGY